MKQAKFKNTAMNLVCGDCGSIMASEETPVSAASAIIYCRWFGCPRNGIRYEYPLPIVTLREVE